MVAAPIISFTRACAASYAAAPYLAVMFSRRSGLLPHAPFIISCASSSVLLLGFAGSVAPAFWFTIACAASYAAAPYLAVIFSRRSGLFPHAPLIISCASSSALLLSAGCGSAFPVTTLSYCARLLLSITAMTFVTYVGLVA